MQLEITSIRTDGGTQPRATYHYGAVDAYAEDMEVGATFPPVVVFYDGADYWLADGFHRVLAAKKIERTAIDADVRQGTQQDAQWYSYSVNQTHGLRRSNEDKKRAVEAALNHPYHAGKSDQEIANHCGVSREYVSRVNNSLVIDHKSDRPTARTGRDGRTINTSNIGKKKKQAPAPKPAPEPEDDEPENEPTSADVVTASPTAIDPDEAFDVALAKFSVGIRQLCRSILDDDLPEVTIQRMIDVFAEAIAVDVS